jgi:flagellar biosynthetic protein FliR
MTQSVNLILSSADYFILLLFRVGALIFSSPIFGRVNIPQVAKIGLIAALTYLFFTIFPQTHPIEYATLIGFVLICVGELLLGIALAFITNLFFSITFIAGHVIDTQIGFGIVNVYDIQNNMQAPMIGTILNITLLLVFFAAGAHLRLIETIYLSIEGLPVGGAVLTPAAALMAAQIFVRAFLIGLTVALPVMASGLVLEIAFGVMMRAVPQIHMFVVGIPIKMMVGMIVLTFMLPVFVNFSSLIFDEMFSAVTSMFAAFMEAP